ncbi:hypothetical protein FOA52_013500 [Chlamydomonas sp. UWO 241]|nr:hypothetical protein FOA52_013500 [Chlamydomonas sp. UWO 241]
MASKKIADDAESAKLPTGSDFHYYDSFEDFRGPLAESRTALQQAMVASSARVQRVSRRGAAPEAPKEPDWSDVQEVTKWAAAVMDDALDAVDAALSSHTSTVASAIAAAAGTSTGVFSLTGGRAGGGAAAASAAASGGSVRVSAGGGDGVKTAWGGGGGRGGERGGSRAAPRPQDAFEDPVDNANEPWRPRLASASGGPPTEFGPGVHPLAEELEALEYAAWQVEAPEPIAPRPLDSCPLCIVETQEALRDMAAELAGERHVAIDLENHSFRSFQGFTCLMQVSTRSSDYIVDVLALRPHIGPALAGVFHDPAVVKVLHGSDRDVEWLQRDFGLCVVNMFDTGQAARVLSLPSAGLAFLLEHFCGVAADKRFQLADWRVRPLSAEMLAYARTDTHYLLYIHDRLKQLLAEVNPAAIPPLLQVEPLPPPPPGADERATRAMRTVLERSRRLCTSLYVREALTEGCGVDAAAKWRLLLNDEQTGVLGALLTWRDGVCREEDESTGYVLPKAQLTTLATGIPDNAKDVKRLLGRHMSEPALRRSSEILAAIEAGRRHGPGARPGAGAAPQASAHAAPAPAPAALAPKVLRPIAPPTTPLAALSTADRQQGGAAARFAPVPASRGGAQTQQQQGPSGGGGAPGSGAGAVGGSATSGMLGGGRKAGGGSAMAGMMGGGRPAGRGGGSAMLGMLGGAGRKRPASPAEPEKL